DLTAIPSELVAKLSLRPRTKVWTRAFDGSFAQRDTFYINLIIEGFELPLVRCVALERSTMLIGRNVLNQFLITLGGKALTSQMERWWLLSESRAARPTTHAASARGAKLPCAKPKDCPGGTRRSPAGLTPDIGAESRSFPSPSPVAVAAARSGTGTRR